MAYSKKVLARFNAPKGFGKIKNPDGVGKVGNLICGDIMHLYLKVGKNKSGEGVIKDITFETFGCVAAIATSSIITDLVKGKTLEEALEIGKKEITDSLDGLPPAKIHCSILAADALAEAIYDYRTKNKQPISAELKARHERIEQAKNLLDERYKDWSA